MTSDRLPHLVHLILLWFLVTLAAWPVFTAVATLFGLWSGEAWQIDAWALEPKRALLARFLEGWLASLVVAAPIGLVAVIDYLILSRYRVTWLFGGILLPIAGIGVALAFYALPDTALPTLAATGLVLALLYRVFDWLHQRTFGIR